MASKPKLTTVPPQAMAPDPADEEQRWLIEVVSQYKEEARTGRVDRIDKSHENKEAFLSHQDFSAKIPGQSAEFLPKISLAAEQFGAFVKKGLVASGDFFSIDLPNDTPLKPHEVVKIIMSFLENLDVRENESKSFTIILSDNVKLALLDSLMIFKIHGRRVAYDEFGVSDDGQELTREKKNRWRLRIDRVPIQNWYPDPTGKGLYEIEIIEMDYSDLVKSAQAGLYDLKVVKKIGEDFTRAEEEKLKDAERNQSESHKPQFRRKVVVTDVWGTFLDKEGNIAYENCNLTLANDKYILTKGGKPQKNPFWHNQSPYVAVPIIRVPGSVWHRALYDDTVSLNLAMNELFNLILDGGMGSVHGVKTIQTEYLSDPAQVSNGVMHGDTIAVKDVPSGVKVIEQVATGAVPQDALATYQVLEREFNAASMTTEINLGQLPQKQASATEVVESQTSQGITLDAVVHDLENDGINRILMKVWLTILQNADDIPEMELASRVGLNTAIKFLLLTPAMRFALYGQEFGIKVNGLSATMNRSRDFQKLMGLLQVIGTNPMLLQSFMGRYDPDKMLDALMRLLNFNPENLQMGQEMLAAAPERIKQLPFFAMLTGGGKSAGMSQAGAGSSEASAVNQVANPLTGMTVANG